MTPRVGEGTVLDNDTIVALATPPGEGGLAVVRVSGPRAFEIARRVFRGGGFGRGRPAPRRAVYGILFGPGGGESVSSQDVDVIDQVVALPFLGPGSYTGEDTVEFFCHGGRMAAALAVEACRAAGAAPAPAGEFTRRAFLNGRLSLDQAEAVADLIQAESAPAARAAVGQMRGGLDAELRAIESPLLGLLTELEGSLEFSDDEDVEPDPARVAAVLRESLAGLDRLLELAPAGRLLREGVHVVLAGPPNAGKSSLFNLLLGEDRALVDAEAGTTRDVVVARRQRASGLYVLHDTAGLRDAPGRVEGMGIARARRAVDDADIVLDLRAVDADAPRGTVAAGGESGPVVIPVVTKMDLADGGALPPGAPPPGTFPPGTLAVSNVTGQGRDAIWDAIETAAATFDVGRAVALGVALNERHRHKLGLCRDELETLVASVGRDAPGAEVVGTVLSSILGNLGEVSGRVFSEQLLDSVFQRFCVGK
jgi:tRNA modification GTPase